MNTFPLYRCSECGILSSPPNGTTYPGPCGIRRGLGSWPARSCPGTPKFVGNLSITDAPEPEKQ